MSETPTEIIPKENSFLQLPVSVDEIVGAMKSYQDLLRKLLVDDDYAVIQSKKCIKKAGWLKLARAFNLSIKIISERKEKDLENTIHYAYHITVSCIASNGREVQEIGTCDKIEKPQAEEHVIRAMAITRAKSRAIASMIGASESSAEEMEIVKDEPPTEKQLEYLKSLGHAGINPKTKQEASALIEKLKNGAAVESTITTDKICKCDDPAFGHDSGRCIKCGGNESK